MGLDAMEKRGLIRRQPDRHDRRISRVWLTPKGLALRAKLVPAVAAYLEQVFVGFTPEECSELEGMIRRLRERIETM